MTGNRPALATYLTVKDVLESQTELLDRVRALRVQLPISKVYLESFREGQAADEQRLIGLRDALRELGLEVSGGITLTSGRSTASGFPTLCYHDRSDLELVERVVSAAARVFDEVIFDDFFFTNCKCALCRAARGTESFAGMRQRRLLEVAHTHVVGVARSVNARVRLVLKYPNWYEHFADLGYDVPALSRVFDGIYVGVESRDACHTQQHLPRYLSYYLPRYLAQVREDGIAGCWFDAFESTASANAYVEQATLGLLAGCDELTFFSLGLITRPPFLGYAAYAASVIEQVSAQRAAIGAAHDGVACYQPFGGAGEEFLPCYLGMLGLPIVGRPSFPDDAPLVLLTAGAASDATVLDRLEAHLDAGRSAVVTSGFVAAVQHAGLDRLTSVRVTARRALMQRFALRPTVAAFGQFVDAPRPMLLPQLEYATNDAWPEVVALSAGYNVPLLLSGQVGPGVLWVLTIPDDYSALYDWPQPVLDRLREVFEVALPITLRAPSQIGLFLGEHGAVVQSFLPHDQPIRISAARPLVDGQGRDARGEHLLGAGTRLVLRFA